MRNRCQICHCQVLLLVILNSVCVAAPEKRKKERTYASGPLATNEFKGAVGEYDQSKANTATRVNYKYKFAYRRVGRSYVVTVTSFDVYAVFLPDESWFGSRASADLLDHEQGHFDIAEIVVRKTKLAFATAKQSGKGLSATGDSRRSAQDAVTKQIAEICAQVDKQIDSANQDYDRTTRHGMREVEQYEKRRIQKLTLDRLEKQLADPKSTRHSRKSSPAK